MVPKFGLNLLLSLPHSIVTSISDNGEEGKEELKEERSADSRGSLLFAVMPVGTQTKGHGYKRQPGQSVPLFALNEGVHSGPKCNLVRGLLA